MSHKKDKQRWINIQENKKKTCLNCSQLRRHTSGEYICTFSNSKEEFERRRGGLIVTQLEAKQPHKCFDKYNGKNLN